MGMLNFRNLRVALGACVVLAATANGAFAAVTGSGCSPSTGSQSSSSDKGCSFDSGGLKSTFISGGTMSYGNLITGGGGSGGPNGGNASINGNSRLALSSRDTGVAGAGAGSKWNAWLSLSQSKVAYDYQPLQSSGRVNVALIGVDYTFSNSVTVGLAAGWDETRVNTTFNGGNLNTKGNMFAPYLSWRINQSWTLDASVGWGRSDVNQTDNSVVGGITGTSKDDRSIASLAISYNRQIGKWYLTGRGAYLGAQDKLSQVNLSNGTTVAATTVNAGQVRIGGQAMYLAGSIMPYVGLHYINDVQRQSQASIGGVNAANDRDAFQLQLGVQFSGKGPVYGGLMFATDVGRSQVKNDLFMGNIGIRF